MSLLDIAQRPALSAQAVRQTMFDDLLFAEMRLTAPRLDDMVDDLNRDYGYTDALVSDTFAALYQSAPQVRERREMLEDCLLHHAVAVNLARAPEVASLRGYTVHEKYYSAMGTIELAHKVREFLKQAEREMQDAALAAEQARQRAEQAEQDAQAQAGQVQGDREALDLLLQALTDALGDFEGSEGPFTQEQAEAQAAVDAANEALTLSEARLQELLDLAEAAREAASAAEDQVDDLADQATRGTRAMVAQAVHEAVEQMAEQAAAFRAWGVEPGELTRMDFAERAAQAQRLKNHRLKDWVKDLGRWKAMRAAQYAKKVANARDEVYDVTPTGHLPDVLPAQFAMLATDPGRLDFLQRLSERQLLGLKFRGKEKIGQGAIIVVVDTSGSMRLAGPGRTVTSREVFAKGLALAMLDQARDEKRDFVGIIFGSAHEQKAWHFPNGHGSLNDVLDFTEEFFGGGTDFQVPLDMAMDILEKQYSDERKAKGDIILITDDDCAVTPKWLAAYAERKARLDFRTFGVAVGMQRAGSTLTSLSDDVRGVLEFHDPSVVADIVRTV